MCFLHAPLFASRWANVAIPKRVSCRSSATTSVSASKITSSGEAGTREPLLPIVRTATMGVANECRLAQKVSRAGGDDDREHKASGVARAVLRPGTTQGARRREALEDAQGRAIWRSERVEQPL